MTEERAISASIVCRLGNQKKPPSELYLVNCKVQSFQIVGDAIRPAVFRRFGTREVTVIYLSFTNCRITIVLPIGCVTLTGGKPKGTRRQA
jgi:hypothetical protein